MCLLFNPHKNMHCPSFQCPNKEMIYPTESTILEMLHRAMLSAQGWDKAE